MNYKAHVYLNGKKLGSHSGGFTPFQFEIDDAILKEKGNYVVVKVDNKRHKDEVPTVNTDWWNYGGITRDVMLVETPPAFVEDYFIQLSSPTSALKPKMKKAEVTVLLNGESVFLRGICLHEEEPNEVRRAKTREDAEQLLGWAEQLNCNFVRLAHYPHNEHIVRAADSLGILLWSEIRFIGQLILVIRKC